MESGSTHPNKDSKNGSQMSAIIKLYDRHINSLKLNEQVTIIGVLEFNLPNIELNTD
jgi:hypothetical protein